MNQRDVEQRKFLITVLRSTIQDEDFISNNNSVLPPLNFKLKFEALPKGSTRIVIILSLSTRVLLR